MPSYPCAVCGKLVELIRRKCKAPVYEYLCPCQHRGVVTQHDYDTWREHVEALAERPEDEYPGDEVYEDE